LKEEHTGRRENSAGKKEAGTKNQGNAVLGSLKSDESHSREDESEKAADHLEVALEERIRLDGDATTKKKPPACERKTAARLCLL
jgi:hypothetical protein